MIGKRIYGYIGVGIPAPGEYWKDERDGHWHAVCPPGKPYLANLGAHDVIEHDDGTITVSPSILVTVPNVGQWHGYLERGVWRQT